MKTFVFLVILFLSTSAFAKRTEKSYVDKWCEGQKEVVLPDQTRCDCLTKTHAIEFDFAKKWAEAIGQSLHYAQQTGKLPGVVLICRIKKDMEKLNRIRSISDFYGLGLSIWSINCGL